MFTPISHLRYGIFDVNLAAGLEDALIAAFDPPWNGRERGQPISEEAEREEAEQVTTASADPVEEARGAPTPLGRFQIKLGEAYYEQGLIYPGVEPSKLLGDHGEPIIILFADGSEPVLSAVNRTANRSGSVRVVGRNAEIAAWMQRHFRKGDVVEAEILDRHHILLALPSLPARASTCVAAAMVPLESGEFFYMENGRCSDADLHDEFLTEEAEAESLRQNRQRLHAEGLDEATLERLYGPEER